MPRDVVHVHAARRATADDVGHGESCHRGRAPPAAVPIAVKSRWSASFLKKPPSRRGTSALQRPRSIDVNVLRISMHTHLLCGTVA